MFLGQYFSSIFIVVFTFSDDFEDEDVQLKYEKRGGEIWVSLDQYKLSSPSPEKLSSPIQTSSTKTTLKAEKLSTDFQKSQNYIFQDHEEIIESDLSPISKENETFQNMSYEKQPKKIFVESPAIKVAILQKGKNEEPLNINQNLILEPETENNKTSKTTNEIKEAQPSIVSLIAAAINSFRHRKASEQDIYEYITENHPFYKLIHANPGQKSALKRYIRIYLNSHKKNGLKVFQAATVSGEETGKWVINPIVTLDYQKMKSKPNYTERGYQNFLEYIMG